jgi:hypothetical protein
LRTRALSIFGFFLGSFLGLYSRGVLGCESPLRAPGKKNAPEKIRSAFVTGNFAKPRLFRLASEIHRRKRGDRVALILKALLAYRTQRPQKWPPLTEGAEDYQKIMMEAAPGSTRFDEVHPEDEQDAKAVGVPLLLTQKMEDSRLGRRVQISWRTAHESWDPHGGTRHYASDLRLAVPRRASESIYHALLPTERLRLAIQITKLFNQGTYENENGSTAPNYFLWLRQAGFYMDPIAALQRAAQGHKIGICAQASYALAGLFIELGYRLPFLRFLSGPDHVGVQLKIPELGRELELDPTPENGDPYLDSEGMDKVSYYLPGGSTPEEIPAFVFAD